MYSSDARRLATPDRARYACSLIGNEKSAGKLEPLGFVFVELRQFGYTVQAEKF